MLSSADCFRLADRLEESGQGAPVFGQAVAGRGPASLGEGPPRLMGIVAPGPVSLADVVPEAHFWADVTAESVVTEVSRREIGSRRIQTGIGPRTSHVF